MSRVNYCHDLDKVDQLLPEERARLAEVCRRHNFRANDYYLSLIDWDNPSDPIRKIVIPQIRELEHFGDLDASDEHTNYVAEGCQHKYPHTVLLLVNEQCGGYCRFCFRKRLFSDENNEASINVGPGIAYIKRNPQVTNVLVTGGDPLLLSTRKIGNIIKKLRAIEHVRIIRIGSKIPAYNPYRIIDDPALVAMLEKYSVPGHRIYVMTHFNAVEELTGAAMAGIDLLLKAGIVISNQTPLLRGINDNPIALRNLLNKLSFAGVVPYYIFQCRPTSGNRPFVVPLVEAYNIFQKALAGVSGTARRARLIMSHALGKIEIVGVTERRIFLRFHRARHRENEGRFMTFYRDDNACWLDGLKAAADETNPVDEYGYGNRRSARYLQIPQPLAANYRTRKDISIKPS